MVRNVPSRSESNQASADAAVELEAQADVVAGVLPAGLRIEWLGVSGYRLTFENRGLFIDPYLSRVPLSSLLLRRTALPEGDLVGRFCPAREGVNETSNGPSSYVSYGVTTTVCSPSPCSAISRCSDSEP